MYKIRDEGKLIPFYQLTEPKTQKEKKKAAMLPL